MQLYDSGGVLDPAVDGHVRFITLSLDGFAQGETSEIGLVLKQNGAFYKGNQSCVLLSAWSSHQSIVTTQDFELVDTGIVAPSVPDFTRNGSPMRFGYFVAPGGMLQTDAAQELESVGVTWGVDNFRIQFALGASADLDGDSDVDQVDYDLFECCASGPAVPYAQGCEDRDFDNDGDVDQTEFGILQRCFSGADVPADPTCE
jgi:hypothetical protein